MKENKMAILCVDDEELILRSLVMQLREYFGHQYDYEVASSPQEAFEVIDELIKEGVTTILVISDWLMPGMKGDEFLSIVHKTYPNMIKIMLTGHADADSLQNAKDNANLFSCVRKPWDKEGLLKMISEALGTKHND